MHDYKYTKRSMEMTHRWARRCLKAFRPKLKSKKEKVKSIGQALFGIVQGGAYKDLRIASAKAIAKMGFDGFGIGGSFGKLEMRKVLDWVIPALPEAKPRHLLGIGSEKDILDAVKRGVDTFDCVAPTRIGRNGSAFIKGGSLNVKAGKFSKDKNPIEKNCGCYTCRNFSRSYLVHLFHAKEMLGPILTTIHNLWFMENLMKGIREKIAKEK